MNIILAFIFSGLVCLLAQIIMDNTNLTPGHLTSIFTVIGAILGCFGIYDKLIAIFGSGARLLIINFGNTITNYVYLGFLKEGILGLLSNMLSGSSLVIGSTIIISFILTIFFKAKD